KDPVRGSRETSASELDNPFTFPMEAAEPEQVSNPLTAESLISPTVVGTSSTPATASNTSSPLQWQQAGRAQKWTMLGAVNMVKFWSVQAVTAIALVVVVSLLLRPIVGLSNFIFDRLPFPIDLSYFVLENGIPLWIIAIGLAALLAVSPWLLDAILQRFYHLQPFRLDDLSPYSSETTRMLKRVCGQRRYPLPTLGLLPTSAPIALTYGGLPQTARIVVSQGLLNQLNEDEIAASYAGELSHIIHWDFALITLVTLTALLPHLAYTQVAAWGDRQSDRVLQSIATIAAAVCYGAYRFCRYPGLWLSRLRLYHSDRTATEITGNPNGLTRALLKVALGLLNDIQQQQQTSALLESLDLFIPVGHQTALASGSVFQQHPTSDVLEWERSNPYRHWLAANHAHAPLGDRLHVLTLYARRWHLPTELKWHTPPSPPASGRQRRQFFLHIAPLLGLLLGLGLTLVLRLVGGVAGQFEVRALSWLWWDETILQGCLLMGFSVGTFLQINPFFPDIKASNLQIEPSLVQLALPAATMPSESQPVRLRGKLIGRRGIAGWLNQDLILQTNTGDIKLHYTSQFGFIGNLLPQRFRPQDFSRSVVTVTGWYRRGVIPWVDVDTIQSQRGNTIKGEHPLLLTYLAVATGLLSAYVILQG
ncbi:M48 family metalloprotease, partial [Oculatella sp. LEGE 06141]|uniref:M48 family metalloprotease n=1 Tax=Oculatella sp. LEGE 06141 TaxID=1828648 RepID=UPI001880978F